MVTANRWHALTTGHWICTRSEARARRFASWPRATQVCCARSRQPCGAVQKLRRDGPLPGARTFCRLAWKLFILRGKKFSATDQARRRPARGLPRSCAMAAKPPPSPPRLRRDCGHRHFRLVAAAAAALPPPKLCRQRPPLSQAPPSTAEHRWSSSQRHKGSLACRRTACLRLRGGGLEQPGSDAEAEASDEADGRRGEHFDATAALQTCARFTFRKLAMHQEWR